MNTKNTSGAEDRLIAEAEADHPGLEDIIQRLDDQLSAWQNMANAEGCRTPDDIGAAFDDLRYQLSELQGK